MSCFFRDYGGCLFFFSCFATANFLLLWSTPSPRRIAIFLVLQFYCGHALGTPKLFRPNPRSFNFIMRPPWRSFFFYNSLPGGGGALCRRSPHIVFPLFCNSLFDGVWVFVARPFPQSFFFSYPYVTDKCFLPRLTDTRTPSSPLNLEFVSSIALPFLSFTSIDSFCMKFLLQDVCPPTHNFFWWVL